MKTIIPFFIIFFVSFITFSPQQKISASESDAVRINKSYLREKDHQAINKYGYLVFKQANKELEFTSLALAVIKAESNFKHDAKSHKGAVGLMQLMPATALDMSEQLGVEISQNDLIDPAINIRLGVSYIKYLEGKLVEIEDEDRRLDLIVASYNSGLHRVKHSFKCRGFKCYIKRANLCTDIQFQENFDSLPEETKDYLNNVKNYYKTFKKAFNTT